MGGNKVAFLCIVSVVVVLIVPFVSPLANNGYVLWYLTVPRVLEAFFVGASLSVNGAVFQGLFRNDLATPYTLGVASGAAFGVTIFMEFVSSYVYAPLLAFGGGFFATLLVWGLGMYAGGSQATLLLAGIAVSFVFSSLILLIQYLGSFSLSFEIIRWMMGNLEVVGYDKLYFVIPVAVLGFVFVLYLHRELDIMLFGDEFAKGKGVDVTRVRFALFFVVSLSTGIMVSACGPVGFVGMMVPHIIRLLVGNSHDRVLVGSFFVGGVFLVLSDLIGRVVIYPTEIPVGVVTALIGGPFFLWLLLRNSRRLL